MNRIKRAIVGLAIVAVGLVGGAAVAAADPTATKVAELPGYVTVDIADYCENGGFTRKVIQNGQRETWVYCYVAPAAE